MKYLLLLMFLLTSPCLAQSQQFLPDNDLYLEDYGFSGNGMTEEIFDASIEEAQRIFGPIFEKYGAILQIAGDWNDSTVNAYASQYENVWRVEMFGGLARRSEVTPDGFFLVIGHEIGHHSATFPQYPGSWAAAEGMSDYYATHAFAKRLWQDMLKTKRTREALYPEVVVHMCDAAYDKIGYQNLCYRSLMASMSLAQLLRALGDDQAIYFDRPDPTIVKKTNASYPRTTQSRLDTMVNGSLCPIKWNFDDLHKTEESSNKYLCWTEQFPEYGRPLSWFKPKL